MKKIIIKNSILYSLPDILTKLLPFATMPIVTKYLTLSDFGLLGVFSIIVAIYMLFTQIGIGYVVNALWFKLNDNRRKKLLFNLFVITLLMSLLSISILFLIGDFLFSFVLGKSIWKEFSDILIFIVLQVFLNSHKALFDSYMIINNHVKVVVKLSILFIVLNTTAYLYFAITTSDIFLVIVSQSLVVSFMSLIYLYYLVPKFNFSFNKYFIYKTLKIGFPIFLRSMFNFIRNRFDKIYIVNLMGASNFAIYNFAFSTSSVMASLGNSFDKSFSPLMYKKLSKKDNDFVEISFLIFLYFYVLCFLIIGFNFFGYELIDFLSNGLFLESYDYILLFFLTYIISSFSMGSGNILIANEKTKDILYTTIIQSLIIIILTIIFVPIYGAKAAVVSLVIGVFYYSTHQYILSRKIIKIDLQEKKIFFYSALYTVVIFNKIFLNYYSGIINSILVLIFFIMTIDLIYFYSKLKKKGLNVIQ